MIKLLTFIGFCFLLMIIFWFLGVAVYLAFYIIAKLIRNMFNDSEEETHELESKDKEND